MEAAGWRLQGEGYGVEVLRGSGGCCGEPNCTAEKPLPGSEPSSLPQKGRIMSKTRPFALEKYISEPRTASQPPREQPGDQLWLLGEEGEGAELSPPPQATLGLLLETQTTREREGDTPRNPPLGKAAGGSLW